MISPGTAITEGQAVMELETERAVVEVPSTVSGVVKEIRVKEGEKIKVGQVIFTFENGAGSVVRTPSPAKEQKAQQAAASASPSKATSVEASAQTAAPTVQRERRVSSSPATTEFKLPELGENIHQGDLVRLMISPGAKVSEGQPVMELETDKAVIEVPSSISGVGKEVRVKQGDKIKVGQVIFTLEGAAAPQQDRPRHVPVEHVSGQHGARLAFQAAIQAEGKTEEQALPPDQPQSFLPSFAMPAQLEKVAGTEHREPVPAAPHVRRLARELGIDVHGVKGSGPGGRISENDVKAYSKSLLASSAVQTPHGAQFAQPDLP